MGDAHNTQPGQLRLSRALRTKSLLRQASAVAHAKHKVPQPLEEQPRTVPLLPVSVGVDSARQEAETREHLLYKLGEAGWDSKSAASRMAWTLGLQEKDEKSIEEEFTKAITSFKRHAAAVESGQGSLLNDVRVLLPVYVKRGTQVLRDEVAFHFGCLGGVGASMAGAVQEYAMTVCKDLGLNLAWFKTVMRHMGALITEVHEDIKATGTSELLLQQASGSGVLRPKAHDLPRVEELNPELEAAERDRTRRREEKLIMRQRMKQHHQQQQHASGSTGGAAAGAAPQQSDAATTVPAPAPVQPTMAQQQQVGQQQADGTQQPAQTQQPPSQQQAAEQQLPGAGQAMQQQQQQQQQQEQMQGLQPAGLGLGPGQGSGNV